MAIVPFYFGPSERPLFGAHHVVERQQGSRHGVLLCYPVGHEYQRSHRFFCQLGNRLAAAGMPVLRFDYSCTGDSWGETNQGTMEEWRENIRTAAAELREIEGLTTLSVVGLRLGATLVASMPAVDPGFDTLVLLDPVVNGREYLSSMRVLHVAVLQHNDPTWAWTSKTDRDSEVLGALVQDRLLSELESVDLLTLPGFPGRRVHIIVSDERESYSALHRRAQELGQECGIVRLGVSAGWDDQFRYGTVLSANAAIDSTVAALTTVNA